MTSDLENDVIDWTLCALQEIPLTYPDMHLKSQEGKTYNQQQAIELLVSLVATDTNSEKKWRGFYNALTPTELKDEWDEHWKP